MNNYERLNFYFIRKKMDPASLTTILYVLVISVTAVQSQITKGPVNALKIVGDSGMLECVTESKNCDQVEWTKMEGAQSPLTVYKNGIILGKFQGRYSVSSTGGCNLTITQLEITDSGKFTCTQIVSDSEKRKSSILVVISVTESCWSNVTSNELNQNDGYSFSTAINVPAKSVEPSNVILSFHNKTDGETETMDDKQPPTTVKITLTGIARKENITQRVCRASFPPNTAADFDSSTASLDVCTTQQFIVSYPVESVTVLPNDGQFHEGNTIICTAEGYPIPTFSWKNLTSGLVVQSGSSLMITKDSFGHNFTCIAANIVNGIEISKQMIVIVPKPSDGSGCSSGCVAGIVVSTILVAGAVVAVVAVVYRKREKDRQEKNGENGQPLKPQEPPHVSVSNQQNK